RFCSTLFAAPRATKRVGSIPLSRAMRSPRDTNLTDIMETELRLVPADMDQEAVAYMFRQYALISAPVVDEGGKLVCVVTVGGVARPAFPDPAHIPAFRRVQWLVVTLINTLIASIVISRFEGTIGQYPSLAVLMPITAAMGGNAGVQVITVTVRALATKEITPNSNV